MVAILCHPPQERIHLPVLVGPCKLSVVLDDDDSLPLHEPDDQTIGMIIFRIERASQSGSTTLASGTGSNTNTSEGSGSDTETATTSTNYELLSSWCYFSEYPWVYSYTNKSWYYLMPSNSGLYAWNENINGDWFNLAAN